jgi:SAM-dependent methyltransferase
LGAKGLDPVEFRDGQRQRWDGVATGWRKWSELIDGAASGISDRLVELAGVKPGDRVLDVAAGYGEPSLSAARAAGPEGSVVATDISAEMLAFGRERRLRRAREHRVRRVGRSRPRVPGGQLRRSAVALRDHLRA